ncbi:hypothetical protein [Streptomyces sp. NBC_01304]|uniref:hypothetical protein n=1 Tax=Streptomyces sp. NBC_01304 TaxID=2903818 RepID=UPI002E14D14E|nr:hypothetical protein OG430_06965 [Streptomyces sp. NBC_01304]
MDAYLAGKDAPVGTPAHALYIWIESLHQRMDLLLAQFTADGWDHDYSIGSLRLLEEDLATLYGTDDGQDSTALYMEALAGYLGEVLLAEGGGRWVWDESAGSVGLPAVEPDPELGLETVVPILLVGQAVYEKTQNVFATVALRLRRAVVRHKAAHPGWRPERVRTPWVRFGELDEVGALWKYWPNERFHDYLTWWADGAGGGRERWDFGPASLDALEALLRERLGTVEQYDKVAGEPFWVQAAWYAAEYVVRRKDAAWQFRKSNPEAPPGTWYAADSYWTDTVFVDQRMRYGGHAEHPTQMLRAVLEGETLRAVVDRFPDPAPAVVPDGATDEPWPRALWPLVAPEHLPAPLTDEEREQLAEEHRELAADPDLKDPDWHDNPRLTAWLDARRASFADWVGQAGGSTADWDFSPASLDRLQAVVREKFATYEEMKATPEDPFLLGASWYFGEVQVVHCGARWTFAPDPEPDSFYGAPTVVEPDLEEDELDDDDEDFDPDDPDDPDAMSGHACAPADHLCGLVLRDDPEERLVDWLKGYRRSPVDDSGR